MSTCIKHAWASTPDGIECAVCKRTPYEYMGDLCERGMSGREAFAASLRETSAAMSAGMGCEVSVDPHGVTIEIDKPPNRAGLS